MAALYHSIFTEQGLALLRESIQNGTKLGITHMSFGDGGGDLPTPDASFTQMVGEVYRVPLNRLAPSNANANWLEADGVIPSAVGGFNIREVGLWADNVMVAYANYPPTYKPSGDQGTAQIKTIRIVLQIDNTANFELKIDASVVMATVEYVNEIKKAENIDYPNYESVLDKVQMSVDLIDFIPKSEHANIRNKISNYDCMPALKQALETGRKIEMRMDGLYKFLTYYNDSKDFDLLAVAPNVYFDFSECKGATYAIQNRGTLTRLPDLTANVVKSSSMITLSNTNGISEGDWI
ncbi:phage tail protein, partial [Acinetobacter baumannii]|nr:phage tail protein [Acinetobacter baumannii]